jgi:hypothetical protein
MTRVAYGVLLAVLTAFTPAVSFATAQKSDSELVVVVNDQESYAPGFSIGVVAVAQPKIADFRTLPARKELLIVGKSVGETRITVWDQAHVKRENILVRVIASPAVDLQRDLRALLADYPDVKVTMLNGALLLTGNAPSESKAVINKIASVAKATTVVRFIPPLSVPEQPPQRPVVDTRVEASATQVEFELVCLELKGKAVAFTGAYRNGAEPSGRQVCRCSVVVPADQDRTVSLPGLDSRQAVGTATDLSPRTCPSVEGSVAAPGALHVSLRPGPANRTGTFRTSLEIHTNLPAPGVDSGSVALRRATFQYAGLLGEAFGVAGTDLLAVLQGGASGSTLRASVQTTATVASLPYVRETPGVKEVVPFSSLFGLPAFRHKKDQLMLLVRPRRFVSSAP